MSEREDTQQGGEPHVTPTWARVVLATLLCVLAAGVLFLALDYERVETPDPHVFIPERAWRVGTPGTYYIWTDHRQRLQSTRMLEHVPKWTLGVLEIWHPDWGARPGSEGGYIVDMQGVEPDEELMARLRSRSYIWSASHATDAGEATGQFTAFMAQEVAAENPDSARARTATQALKQFKIIEDRLPPTADELITAYKKKVAELEARRQHTNKK
jgi:hypothetical protein